MNAPVVNTSRFEDLFLKTMAFVAKQSERRRDDGSAALPEPCLEDYDHFYRFISGEFRDPVALSAQELGLAPVRMHRASWSKVRTLGVGGGGGLSGKVRARLIFERSAESNDSTPLFQHLAKYYRSARAGKIILAAEKAYSEVIDQLIKTYTQGGRDRSSTTGYPGLLVGEDDPRIAAHHGEVVGREALISEVVSFLESDSKSAHIWGVAGIGKTELCKASLRCWIGKCDRAAIWIELNERSTAANLLTELALAKGLEYSPATELVNLKQVGDLPSAVYCLDGVEFLVESAEGASLVRELGAIPGIRLLATSRVNVERLLGKPFLCNPIDSSFAVELLKRHWNGAPIENDDEIFALTTDALGGHPLCIVLLAVLGYIFSPKELFDEWKKYGTVLGSYGGNTKNDNLSICFAVTLSQILTIDKIVPMWQFFSFAPQGLPESLAKDFATKINASGALVTLFRHRLITAEDGDFLMLPPVRRFVEDALFWRMSQDHGIDWNTERRALYSFFEGVLVSQNVRSLEESRRNDWLKFIDYLIDPLASLISYDVKFGSVESKSAIAELHSLLSTAYVLKMRRCHALLTAVHAALGDSNSARYLGEIALGEGKFDLARELFAKATSAAENDDDVVNRACAIKAIGDLEARSLNYKAAAANYQESISLFKSVENWSGAATATMSMSELHRLIGDSDGAIELIVGALMLFEVEDRQHGCAMCLTLLGNIYYELGDNLDMAHDCYSRAEKICRAESLEEELGSVCLGLGRIYSEREMHDKADKLLIEAVLQLSKSSDRLMYGMSLLSYGRSQCKQRKFESAKNFLNNAGVVFLEAQSNWGVCESVRAIMVMAIDEFGSQFDQELMRTSLNLYQHYALLITVEDLRRRSILSLRSFCLMAASHAGETFVDFLNNFVGPDVAESLLRANANRDGL